MSLSIGEIIGIAIASVIVITAGGTMIAKRKTKKRDKFDSNSLSSNESRGPRTSSSDPDVDRRRELRENGISNSDDVPYDKLIIASGKKKTKTKTKKNRGK